MHISCAFQFRFGLTVGRYGTELGSFRSGMRCTLASVDGTGKELDGAVEHVGQMLPLAIVGLQ